MERTVKMGFTYGSILVPKGTKLSQQGNSFTVITVGPTTKCYSSLQVGQVLDLSDKDETLQQCLD